MLGTFRAGRNPNLPLFFRLNAITPRNSRYSSWLPIHGRRYSETSGTHPTKIEKIILDTIKATGPIPFATYMQLCLSHPTEGYYMKPSNPVFGSYGDFTTSPEISQVFGELVGIWLISQWMKAGRPPSIRLIELGPGRGTLMDDILRVVSQIASSGTALKRVHLVETSPAMRSMQKTKLLPSSQKGGWELVWHDSIDDISPNSVEYTMLVAHEFFDALPIHVLEKTPQGWQEVLIASAADPQSPSHLTSDLASSKPSTIPPSQTRLRRVLSPTPTAASTLLGLSSPRFQNLPIGARIEVSPAAFKIARKVGQVLSSRTSGADQGIQRHGAGGSGLIVDYGGAKVFGDSFRAFKDHKIVDVFHRPGECDLTANVDFAYLKESLADLAMPHGPLPQYVFLERMGVQLRAEALVRAAKSDERKDAIGDAVKRLVDRTGMGKEYLVLGVTSDTSTSAGDSEDVWPFMEVKDGTT